MMAKVLSGRFHFTIQHNKEHLVAFFVAIQLSRSPVRSCYATYEEIHLFTFHAFYRFFFCFPFCSFCVLYFEISHSYIVVGSEAAAWLLLYTFILDSILKD